MLLNRGVRSVHDPPKQIETALGIGIHHTFPSDYKTVSTALNSGVPLALADNSEIAAQFDSFTRQIIDPRRGREKAPPSEARRPRSDRVSLVSRDFHVMLRTKLPESPASGPYRMPVAPSALRATQQYVELKANVHRKLLNRLNLEALAHADRRARRAKSARWWVSCSPRKRRRSACPSARTLISEVLDEMFGFGPLEPLLRDPTISDILVNGLQARCTSSAAAS